MAPIVVGTRATPLARIQAELVSNRLRDLGVATTIRAMSSQGDRSLGGSFAQAKGAFTGELSAALRSGAVDLVVHSLKDLPVDEEADLPIAAVPERERPYDLLLVGPGVEVAHPASPVEELLGHADANVPDRTAAASEAFAALPASARLGTSSPRRQSGALALRPDLVCCAVRGSVGRRLEWLRSGAIDALLAAEAGLIRLAADGQLDPAAAATSGFRLDLRSWPCAPGQGALAIQILRGGRLDGHPALVELDHPPTRTAAMAERRLLGRLGGGCQRPFGAWAEATAPAEAPAVRAVYTLIAPDDWRRSAAAGSPPRAIPVGRSRDSAGKEVDLDALADEIEQTLQTPAGLPDGNETDAPDLIVTTAPLGAQRISRLLPPDVHVASLPATKVESFERDWPSDRVDLEGPRRQWPWLLISSPTAARVAVERAERDPLWGRLPWCALGEGTARALLAAEVPPNLAAQAQDGQSFATYVGKVLDPECPLFVPHSARGGRGLVDTLRAAGRTVVAWEAYTVHPDPHLAWPGGWQAARARVLFTAPSAVAAFAVAGLAWPGSCWAIGATTAAALRSQGVGNVKSAQEPTAAGIARLWHEEAGSRPAAETTR